MARVTRERGDGCLVCEMIERAHVSDSLMLHRDRDTTVVLSRYPRQWGHILILLNRHCTNFSELDVAEWQALSAMSLHAARVVEQALEPTRCYVASLGSARTDLPMSSPHLHMHVVPIYAVNAKPASIFSWERGVYDAPRQEWEALGGSLRERWMTLEY